jgi:hypothetical protein
MLPNLSSSFDGSFERLFLESVTRDAVFGIAGSPRRPSHGVFLKVPTQQEIIEDFDSHLQGENTGWDRSSKTPEKRPSGRQISAWRRRGTAAIERRRPPAGSH